MSVGSPVYGRVPAVIPHSVAIKGPRPYANVMAHGAVGNAVADDTAAFQAAIDAAYAIGGGEVWVPPTATGYLISGQLVVKPYVTLRGAWSAPPRGSYSRAISAQQLRGSQLNLTFGSGGTAVANAAITLKRGAAVKGLVFFYPNQTASPVAYPPTVVFESAVVESGSEGGAVIDCNFLNSYIGIWSDQHEKTYIERMRGEPANLGIYIDNCFDRPTLRDIGFWKFWSQGNGSLAAWDTYRRASGTGIKLGKMDNLLGSDIQVLGMSVGFHLFESSANNGGPKGRIVQANTDECTTGILVDAIGSGLGFHFTNGCFYIPSGTDGRLVKYQGNPNTSNDGGGLFLNNCYLDGTSCTNLVEITSAAVAGFVKVAGGQTNLWSSTANSAAVKLSSTTVGLEIDGTRFERTGASVYQLDLSDLANTATNACRFRPGFCNGGQRVRHGGTASTAKAIDPLILQVNSNGTQNVATVVDATGAALANIGSDRGLRFPYLAHPTTSGIGKVDVSGTLAGAYAAQANNDALPALMAEKTHASAGAQPVFVFKTANGTVSWYISTATPEGSITAAAGSICIDATNANIYTKTGSGNTGWKLVTRAA